MKRRLFTTILVFVMLLLFISSPLLLQQKTSAQGNPPPPDLFGSASTPPGYLPPDAQSTIRSRFVTVDSGQLTPQTASLTLNLFPDTSYLAVFEESTVPDPLTPGRFIWQGAIDGIPDGHATLAVNEESLAVTVYLPNALYHIIDTGEGPFFVSQTTLDDPMPEMAPIPVSLPPDQAEIQTP